MIACDGFIWICRNLLHLFLLFFRIWKDVFSNKSIFYLLDFWRNFMNRRVADVEPSPLFNTHA